MTTDGMRIAIDTNVLVYAEDLDDPSRGQAARSILAAVARGHEPVLPVQVLGEFFRTLRRKAKMEPTAAATVVRRWRRFADLAASDDIVFDEALEISVTRGLDIWDAVILATTRSSGCSVLLSEDFQDGFAWRGVTVANPFSSPVHAILASILEH
jgi:predicted nucleic acid-binding protein